ncbi:MAG: Na+/H+ antiporter subunit [Homoserinimonas sp.]|jgi:multicomponent Na+:H+ antiporter subunit E|nr:Na+/H+ antiporter subunit [Mycetocola sp.]MCU1546395.1 Na+/H+ antiporter subunit [Homoserinimonas sp.]
MPEFSGRSVRRSWAHQIPLLLWLVVLWMLLWGSFSWLNLVTGAIIAVLVTRVFYLPPVLLSGRFNLRWALVFSAHFVYDLIKGSIIVAWTAIRPGAVPRSSVIAVPLRTRSDLIMTLTTIAISLVPGSLVVETDRVRSLLYVHALATDDEAAVEQARQIVLTVEARIIRAMGSKDDLKRLVENRRAA